MGKMLRLAEEEYQFVRDIRNGSKQALHNIDCQKLDLSKGVIAIFCVDGNRSVDLMQHVVSIVAEQCGVPEPEVWVVTEIGGVLCIPHKTPVVRSGSTRSTDMIHTIRTIMEELTDSRTILTIGHGPCGGAHKAGLSIQRNFMLNQCAKTRLESELGRFKPNIVPLFHIDYTGHRTDGAKQKCTYFFDKHGWHAIYSPGNQ